MICNSCGKEFSDSFGFCPFCGTKAVKKQFCIKCGAELVEGAAFCGVCGAKIGGQAAAVEKFDPTHYSRERISVYNMDTDIQKNYFADEPFEYNGKEYSLWERECVHGDDWRDDDFYRYHESYVVSSDLEVLDSVIGEITDLAIYNGKLYAYGRYNSPKGSPMFFRCLNNRADILTTDTVHFIYSSRDGFKKINGVPFLFACNAAIVDFNGKIIVKSEELSNIAPCHEDCSYQWVNPTWGDNSDQFGIQKMYSVNASIIGNNFVVADYLSLLNLRDSYYFVIDPEKGISSGPYKLAGDGDYRFVPAEL